MGPIPGQCAVGLSPRVRGNQEQLADLVKAIGSIPARAGEPAPARHTHQHYQVYPRACGGTYYCLLCQRSVSGLSPRVRGNQVGQHAAALALRSIPARAGEPRSRLTVWHATSVYPRACGGTSACSAASASSCGLSPRVRGNRADLIRRASGRRSIPARAGEPRVSRWASVLRRVYPRACGGTAGGGLWVAAQAGLSPRVRGNHVQVGRHGGWPRSIPARAGEPAGFSGGSGESGVYPRACGGTLLPPCAGSALRGLSPRVRGNPQRPQPRGWMVRSIPARAGEPFTAAARPTATRVYPRACGGTDRAGEGQAVAAGLSPRVRGNPSGATTSSGRIGSIPARAGGTVPSMTVVVLGSGLSPRVRGNRASASGR